MNTSTIANVVTMQRRRYYSKFPMKFPLITNVLTMQRRRCCTFDSPGLTSESEVYPGLFAVSGNNAVGVVLLFLGILLRHSTQKTYNTYGVDLLTTRVTLGRLTPNQGYQKHNAYSVDYQ